MVKSAVEKELHSIMRPELAKDVSDMVARKALHAAARFERLFKRGSVQ